jgi:hypothetical protein
MAYENLETIAETLRKIQAHEYVLPAIQREFVWRPAQISRLFDSLLRGYPIGSFLFWQVERERVRDYQYYDFITKYHELRAAHCPPLDLLPDRPVIAVLDGQQRITALNIGLRGSHAEKEPRKWWNNPDAFPIKQLYLNLRKQAEENEEGLRYDFRFLTPERAAHESETEFWFPVDKILHMEPGPDIYDYLADAGLAGAKDANRALHRLHTAVHVERAINYHLERDQDLHNVLDIFIRVNSGGTVLSYSDLLLSIATAQWKKLPAREAIHELVDELNETRMKFSFSKDFVLKAGLMLSDIASVGFNVTNFTQDNMQVLEENWSRIARALRLTVQIAADFGFSGQTLRADSALLPVAYYLYQRDASASYLSSKDTREDRGAIRQWLIRSLLKSGIWGSGLDTLLTAVRSVIQTEGRDRFPVEGIESVFMRRGRSLRFEEEEIEDLLDGTSGDRRTFPLLALLYPYFDLQTDFHIDHVFPKSLFTEARLRTAGIATDLAQRFRESVDRLPNLQLLAGSANQSKSAQLPKSWIDDTFPTPEAAEDYRARHDLGDVPEDLTEFLAFFDARRERMRVRLRELLGGPVTSPAERPGPTSA